MKRRQFVQSLGLGVATLAVPGCLGGKKPLAKKPNILFIMTDDHASHAMSCYGSRINTTPNIDRIASEGIRFENCFCTNSICAPSRAVILTGKHSHLNGVRDNALRFDGTQQTFPKLLQQSGYSAAAALHRRDDSRPPAPREALALERSPIILIALEHGPDGVQVRRDA